MTDNGLVLVRNAGYTGTASCLPLGNVSEESDAVKC